MGRLRAAMNWFSNLSLPRKRYILSAALIPMALAFIIGMGTVTGVELASGKSLSCSVWNKCPVSADGTDVGTRPSIAGGGNRADNSEQIQDQQAVDPAQELDPADPAQNQQVPSDPGAQPAQPADPQQETPSQPATPEPETPAQEPTPAEDPVVEEAPPEQQTPSEPPAESPAPSDPSSGSAQEPAPSEP
jgi:hypothetical protein